MVTAPGNEIDEELKQDFLQEFAEIQKNVSTIVDNLNNSLPSSSLTVTEAINSLFRGIHTLKGNLQMLNLPRLAELTHNVEDALAAIRAKQQNYLPELGKMILLFFKKLETIINQEFDPKLNASETRDDEFITALTTATQKITAQAPAQRITFINETIALLQEKGSTGSQSKQDLEFFSNISKAINAKLEHHLEFVEIANKVATEMNKKSDYPVTEEFITAAIYLIHLNHGFKVADPTNRKNISIEKTTASHTSEKLLNLFPHWRSTSEIITQVTETLTREKPLTTAELTNFCPGAKIVAIAQSFAAMLAAMPYSKKHSVISAIMEINRLVDIKFERYWVTTFNLVIKQLYQVEKTTVGD